jgi:hypothetical protein
LRSQNRALTLFSRNNQAGLKDKSSFAQSLAAENAPFIAGVSSATGKPPDLAEARDNNR